MNTSVIILIATSLSQSLQLTNQTYATKGNISTSLQLIEKIKLFFFNILLI